MERGVRPAELYSPGGGEHSDHLSTNISLTAEPVRLSLQAVVNTFLFLPLWTLYCRCYSDSYLNSA